MSSSLWNVPSRAGLAETVERVRAAVGQNPEQFAQRLMAENPAFAAFVRENRGKSARQIVDEMGGDWSAIAPLLGNRRQ